MLAAAAHLVLQQAHEVEHGGLAGELAVDGQRLHCHAHGAKGALVATAVVNGGKQRLLLVVVFRQQETECRGEEVALEDAVVFAELVDARHVNAQSAKLACLAVLALIAVGQELGEGVATVEVGGIPALGIVKGWKLACLGLIEGNLRHADGLGRDVLASVGALNVVKQHAQRGAIGYDVVNVYDKIIVIAVAHQSHAKQATAINVKWLDKVLFLVLYIIYLLYL